MYQRILLMDDGSDLSRRAIPHAATLASITGAAVLVLRISHAAGEDARRLTPDSWDAYLQAARSGAATSGAHLEADPPLSEVTAALVEAGVERVASLVVRDDDPGSAILTAAHNLHCDLIVMSTHGLSGMRRSVLGSVADHVVRHADGIPVLIAR